MCSLKAHLNCGNHKKCNIVPNKNIRCECTCTCVVSKKGSHPTVYIKRCWIESRFFRARVHNLSCCLQAGKEDADPVVARQLAGSHLARAHSHASGEQSLLRSGMPAKTTVMIAQLGRGEVFGDVAVLASRADALTQPFTVVRSQPSDRRSPHGRV